MTTTTIVFPNKLKRLLLFFIPMFVFATSHAQDQEGEQKIVYNKLEAVGDPIFSQDGIASLLAEGMYLYVATNTNGLQVFDISEPFIPVLVGSLRDISIPTGGIAKKGNYIYLSDNVNGIDIIDVSNPTQPISNSSLKTASGESWDLCLDESKEFLFVATGAGGIEVWSLKDPSVPSRVASTSALLAWNYAWGVSYNNKRLIVSDREGGVKFLDAAKPTQLKFIGAYTGTTTSRYAYSKGDYTYLGNGVNGFEVINTKSLTLTSSVFKASYTLPLVIGIAEYPLNPNMVFVATGKSGLAVYDTREFGKLNSEPLDKFVNTSSEYTHMTFSGHTIYVGSTDKGFQVFNYNLTPIFTNLKNHVVNENELISYTIEGHDPDSSAIVVSLTEQSGALPKGFRYDQALKSFTWTPTYEQSGLYTFLATIQEQSPDLLSRTESFTIEVKHINRQPTLPQPLAQLTTEDSLLIYIIPEAFDPDIEDKGQLSYFSENLPRGSSFEPTTRKFSWTPDYTQSGDYVVRFTVKDANTDGKNDGKDSLSDSKELKIRVDNVNLNPEFVRLESQTFAENKPQTFSVSATDPDIEDEGKLLFKALKLPQGATFDATTRTFSWTPTFEQAGKYVAEFEVDDQGLDFKLKPDREFMLNDTMSVFIEVKQTNRPPVFATIEPKSVKENEVLTFSTPASDPDKEDLGKLQYSAVNLPEGAKYDTLSHTFTWKPTFEQSGNYSVTFKTEDTGIDGIPLSDIKEVAISVVHVNRQPTLDSLANSKTDENTDLSFSVTASDPDREDAGKLVISLDNLPKGATFDGANFTWKPDYTQNGVYKLSFTVKDPEGLQNTKSMTITVANTNRAPKFEPVVVGETVESKKVTFVVKAIDEDKEDVGKLTFKAGEMPTGATFNPSNQTFVWTPTFDQAGEYQVDFTVSDKGLTGTATLQPNSEKVLSDKISVPISVKQLNRKPKLEKIAPQSASENEQFSLEFIANDPDKEDQGKLLYSISNLPQGSSLDGNKFTWTPNYDQSGKTVLKVKVTDSGIDGTPLSDETDVVINVKNVNRAPKINDIPDVNASVDQSITFTVTASDDDQEDTGKLKLVASNLPKGAKFKGNSFEWTPTQKQAGTYNVSFTVTDKAGAKETKSVKITVADLPSVATPPGQ